MDIFERNRLEKNLMRRLVSERRWAYLSVASALIAAEMALLRLLT